jgi:ABC-type molybdate transport system substrate-binding protein
LLELAHTPRHGRHAQSRGPSPHGSTRSSTGVAIHGGIGIDGVDIDAGRCSLQLGWCRSAAFGDHPLRDVRRIAIATSPSPVAADLTIFGAASLSKVLEQVKTAYETANPGSALTISTDSSAALEMKIEEGAPADVFLSADTINPKKLIDGGFADGDAVDFAGNELTIITPVGNPGGLTNPFDLAKSGSA